MRSTLRSTFQDLTKKDAGGTENKQALLGIPVNEIFLEAPVFMLEAPSSINFSSCISDQLEIIQENQFPSYTLEKATLLEKNDSSSSNGYTIITENGETVEGCVLTPIRMFNYPNNPTLEAFVPDGLECLELSVTEEDRTHISKIFDQAFDNQCDSLKITEIEAASLTNKDVLTSEEVDSANIDDLISCLENKGADGIRVLDLIEFDDPEKLQSLLDDNDNWTKTEISQFEDFQSMNLPKDFVYNNRSERPVSLENNLTSSEIKNEASDVKHVSELMKYEDLDETKAILTGNEAKMEIPQSENLQPMDSAKIIAEIKNELMVSTENNLTSSHGNDPSIFVAEGSSIEQYKFEQEHGASSGTSSESYFAAKITPRANDSNRIEVTIKIGSNEIVVNVPTIFEINQQLEGRNPIHTSTSINFP